VAAERVGRDQIVVDVDSPADVGALKQAMCRQFPQLEPLAAQLLVAVDRQYADDAHAISPQSEVALIPPVSGG
jgi:molybdopterin converting factor small subunit